MLKMSFLRIMVKRSIEEKQQEETEKQQHVIVTKNNLFKILLQKVIEIKTESNATSLTASVDGAADLPASNLPQRKEFHEKPLSSLPHYFWS